MGGIEGHAVPAAGEELLIGRLEAFGRADHAVLQPAALAVADAVERRQALRGEAAGRIEDRGHQIGRELGEIRQGDQPRQIGELLQAEGDIVKRRTVGVHRVMSLTDWAADRGSLVAAS